MMFTVHYTHLYYRASHESSLQFPNERLEPDYWGSLYFPFTIVVASQTTDVNIRSRAVWRAVLGQLLLSLLLNTNILTLSINIAADLFS